MLSLLMDSKWKIIKMKMENWRIFLIVLKFIIPIKTIRKIFKISNSLKNISKRLLVSRRVTQNLRLVTCKKAGALSHLLTSWKKGSRRQMIFRKITRLDQRSIHALFAKDPLLKLKHWEDTSASHTQTWASSSQRRFP